MNANHLKSQGGLECYACHSAWQNNCYGCHFSRDLGQTALDMVLGQATLGKPVTDDKYFVNFKAFHMGWNSEGKVAPYVTGCQVLATVKDSQGQFIMKQKPPVTARGLSGLAMNPVQPHTTRTTPRWCVECHRNPAALGLGTESFNLSRTWLFALSPAPQGAIQVIDRRTPSSPILAASLPLPDPRDLVVVTDPILGRAQVAYVADGTSGLMAIDLANPLAPAVASIQAIGDARDLALAGKTLYVAAGSQGILTFDLTDPLAPFQVSSFPTNEARAVAVHGFQVLIADGADGLKVVNATVRTSPALVSVLDLNGSDPSPNDAWDVFPFPLYGNAPFAGEKPFVMLVFVADGASGVRVVFFDNPALPFGFGTLPTTDARAVFAKYHYDRGSSTEASLEREYLFVADGLGGIRIANIGNPMMPAIVATVPSASPVFDLLAANAFEPPDNKLYLYAALGPGGCAIFDASNIQNPAHLATVPVPVTRGLDLERILLDRFVDEDGQQWKDSSHDGARPFNRAELERILGMQF